MSSGDELDDNDGGMEMAKTQIGWKENDTVARGKRDQPELLRCIANTGVWKTRTMPGKLINIINDRREKCCRTTKMHAA